MRKLYALLPLPLLLLLSGCDQSTRDLATQGGKAGAKAGSAAGQAAADAAQRDPHLAAAAIVAVAGAAVLKFLLKSVQVKYLLVAAAVAWIAYAAGQAAR